MLEVLDRLQDHARANPDGVALQQVAPACAAIAPMTWRQVWIATMALTERLTETVEPQGTVLVCSPNRPEFVVAFLATLAADLTVFPVHPTLTPAELESAARRSGATTCIGLRPVCKALASCCSNSIDLDELRQLTISKVLPHSHNRAAMLLQSSGTTGPPKIVHRDGAALNAVTRSVAASAMLTTGDHVLAAVPLCHSYGVESALLAPVFAGAAIQLCDGFDPATVCRAVESGNISVFPGVPFMFEMLAERCTAAPILRLAYSAGGPLPQCIFDRARERLGVRIGQLYGSTEVGAVTFNDPSTPFAFDPRSVGRAMPGVEIRVLDADRPDVDQPLANGHTGQVAIASPTMLNRYIDDSTPPVVDGFFFTGDLGHMNARGELTITGRMKLQIDVGGLKVNPIEVEQVILLHEAVRECAVVPLSVSQTLNRLKTVVALKPGYESVSMEELREFVRGRLASYKVPRVFELRDRLPKSPTGKVLREALRCE
jgi:long-chain acyl-CoA synthetase